MANVADNALGRLEGTARDLKNPYRTARWSWTARRPSGQEPGRSSFSRSARTRPGSSLATVRRIRRIRGCRSCSPHSRRCMRSWGASSCGRSSITRSACTPQRDCAAPRRAARGTAHGVALSSSGSQALTKALVLLGTVSTAIRRVRSSIPSCPALNGCSRSLSCSAHVVARVRARSRSTLASRFAPSTVTWTRCAQRVFRSKETPATAIGSCKSLIFARSHSTTRRPTCSRSPHARLPRRSHRRLEGRWHFHVSRRLFV